jgi:beta-lactamase class A
VSAPAAIAALIAPYAESVSLAAAHQPSGRRILVRADAVHQAASVIKVAILGCFWHHVEAGAIAAGERVTLQAHDRTAGSGVLRALAPGVQMTWGDLATLMITVSDNSATNMILTRLGLAAIQRWIDAQGLRSTRIQRLMMDFAALAEGRTNTTTCTDTLALLEAIDRRTCVSPSASDAMRRALEAQQLHGKLGARLPDGARYAGKTGAHSGVSHDCGWIEYDGGAWTVALLTTGIEPGWRADELIAAVGAELAASAGDARFSDE